MKQFNRVYRPIEALPMMGVNCTESTADAYIRNMREAGLLTTSYKQSHRWCITDTDIDFIREKIITGEYVATAKYFKKAA